MNPKPYKPTTMEPSYLKYKPQKKELLWGLNPKPTILEPS